VVSCFRRDVDEICALQGYYAAQSGNFLPLKIGPIFVAKRQYGTTILSYVISQKSAYLNVYIVFLLQREGPRFEPIQTLGNIVVFF